LWLQHTNRSAQSLHSASTIPSLANSKDSSFLSNRQSCAQHDCCFSTIGWWQSWDSTSIRSMPTTGQRYLQERHCPTAQHRLLRHTQATSSVDSYRNSATAVLL